MLMRFRKTSPPSPAAVLALPTQAGEYLVTVPSLNLFKEENIFWRQKQREADKADDTAGRSMAQRISGSLRSIALGRLTIEEMILGITPMNAVEAGSWYATSVSIMALSRMWREVSESSTEDSQGFSLGFATPDACIDFDDTELYKGGLHFKQELLHESVGIDWPEEADTPELYEGESIYLRASRPAQPTRTLVRSYAAFYGAPFVPDEFTTIASHLKREVWEG